MSHSNTFLQKLQNLLFLYNYLLYGQMLLINVVLYTKQLMLQCTHTDLKKWHCKESTLRLIRTHSGRWFRAPTSNVPKIEKQEDTTPCKTCRIETIKYIKPSTSTIESKCSTRGNPSDSYSEGNRGRDRG